MGLGSWYNLLGGGCVGRATRVEEPGTIYHVIQRGNNREYIFREYMEKENLYDRIKSYKQKIGFSLYGYCIMGNHYHLIIQTQQTPLQKIMHMINNSYSKYYNASRMRTGHVFGGRYKSIPVQDERYLLTLLRYVHQNPVRANICQYSWDYYWSSDHAFRNNDNSLVDIDFVLDIISQDRQKAIEKYISFMNIKESEDCEYIDILGDESFALSTKPRQEVVQRKRLDEILIQTGLTQEEFQLVKKGSRQRSLTMYKKAYAQEAVMHGYTQEEIAANIGLTKVAIQKLLYRL